MKFAFSSGKPIPYVIDSQSGLEVEIVNEAFKQVGIEVEAVWLTYNRMSFIQQLDIHGRGVTKARVSDGLFYSKPYIYYQDVALTRAESDIKLVDVQDMAGYTIGSWQTAAQDIGGKFGYMFGEKGRFRNDYFPVFDDYRRVKMFWVGNLDIVVMDLVIFDHFTQKIAIEMGQTLNYDVHCLWGDKHWFQAAFKTQEYRDLFNMGLSLLQAEDAYQAIYSKYTSGVKTHCAASSP